MEQIADIPTNAEQVAGLLTGANTMKMLGALRPCLVRIPEWQLVQLDAMAKLAGKSRSAMMVHLIDVGLQEVDRCLPPTTKALIYEIRKTRLAQLEADTSDRESGEVS